MAHPHPHPSLPTPAPLRGHEGGFTRDSISRRLPLILDETLAHGRDASPALPAGVAVALLTLKQEILLDAPLAPLAPHPDNAACGFEVAPLPGETWLRAPWFLVENYMYRRILDACRAGGWQHDPFASQKRASLASAAAAFTTTVLPLAAVRDEHVPLGALLLRALWGNRADLSLHTVEALAAAQRDALTATACAAAAAEAAALLVDDTGAAVSLLRGAVEGGASPRTVGIILDNCGLELLSDLALADGLLRSGAAGAVVLWAKTHPVFVSDVTRRADVDSHVEWVAALPGDAAAALAARLRGALAGGTLRVHDDPFFNSPLPYWALPRGGALHTQLAACGLVIVKGDANYRRLLGDAHWPHATPFAAVTAYFPAPLLALRTCKAGVVCGLPAEAEARAAALDPDGWLVSGHFGLAQLNASRANLNAA